MVSILKTTQHPSLPVAVLLAHASETGYYTSQDQAKSWAKANGFTKGATCFNESSVQGFWCVEKDVALLAFRGSQNIADWIRNIRVMPWLHKWGLVHKGFLDGVNDVESYLQQFAAAAKQVKYVWVTGHSLGGAMAVIAAAWLKINGIAATVYTFGQPTLAFNDFAQRFAMELPGKYVRFVNQNDIVPQIPPFYRHFGMVKRIVRPGVLESVHLESTLEESPEMTAARHALGNAGLESARAADAAGITVPLLIDADLPLLTEQQFVDLQVALGAASPDSQLESVNLESTLPSVQDHAISEYIRLLTDIRDKVS